MLFSTFLFFLRTNAEEEAIQIPRLVHLCVLRRDDFNVRRFVFKSWRSRRSTGVDVFSTDDGTDDGVRRLDERGVEGDVGWERGIIIEFG